ncbi:MAG TPA: thiamine pyrophosphate-dependent dehydrogenase E1 component subunit alpha, partial [Chitinophagales bacterium]|nr:thiamine pyrophosphate-dependent dehydrogenase E1 component subunit alpha [Chitinophagales bacterium]
MTLISSNPLITKGVRQQVSFDEFKDEVINDYKLACISREMSLTGRKEVLTGKAKFGIFGDGKELPQIALAKVFENGDFRAGYYRDQTFALATGIVTVEQLFGQLYANPSSEEDPHSGGRQMNNHFATRSLHRDGSWKTLKNQKNTSADLSSTAAQMPRSLGLALASKKYRDLQNIIGENGFSNQGNEVCFATIGDASTSEGLFWEVVNAAGVQQVPLVISVWDDGYGISVPKKYQTTKESISKIVKGFQKTGNSNGIDIYVVKGWNYPQLVATYKLATDKTRKTFVPALIHVEELTQPQGHSTSGSHERYKTPERLQWEREHDCNVQFKKWILQSNIATADELTAIEADAKRYVAEQKKISWKKLHGPVMEELHEVSSIIHKIAATSVHKERLEELDKILKFAVDPLRKEVFETVSAVLILVKDEQNDAINELKKWRAAQTQI